MPSSKEMPVYEAKLYELCDVFEVIANGRGDRVAEASVDRLLSQTIKSYPRAAEVALGKGRLANLVATYKQAPGMQSVELPVALASALTKLRSQMDDAQVTQLLSGVSMPDVVMAELSGKTAGAGTLASDQKPPSKRTKEQRRGMAALFDEGIKEYGR